MQKLTPKNTQFQVFEIPIQFQVSENFQNQNNLSFQFFFFFLNFEELVVFMKELAKNWWLRLGSLTKISYCF
jgi:hypothetical protein